MHCCFSRAICRALQPRCCDAFCALAKMEHAPCLLPRATKMAFRFSSRALLWQSSSDSGGSRNVLCRNFARLLARRNSESQRVRCSTSIRQRISRKREEGALRSSSILDALRLSGLASARIVHAMFRRLVPMTVCFASAATVFAETVQLRDRAAVTGTVLAEKRDQIVVDLGYTVLTIPRSSIVKITKEEEAPKE